MPAENTNPSGRTVDLCGRFIFEGVTAAICEPHFRVKALSADGDPLPCIYIDTADDPREERVGPWRAHSRGLARVHGNVWWLGENRFPARMQKPVVEFVDECPSKN